MDKRAVLTVSNLRKSFGGIQALKGVDFDLQAGEIHALCGENGAGKSTLVRMIAGLMAPDAGEIRIGDELLKAGELTSPKQVSVVYQELSIIPHLSVLDNVLLGDPDISQLYLRRRYTARVRETLNQLGLANVPLDIEAGRLAIAEQQLLEICRAVMRGARVLILDEPTASLSDAEIQRVFETVRWLRGQGTAVIYISHRLPEIFALTDRVTVFRNGQRVMTKPTGEWTNDELVTEMIGREVSSAHSIRNSADLAAADTVVRLAGLGVPGKFRPVDLSFRKGEIVGLIGQLGAGANAMVETLAGLERHYAGSISIDGQAVNVTSIAAATRAGIAYVSEDRGGKSLFLGAPIEVNLTAAILDRLNRFGVLALADARQRANDLARRFQIDSRRLPLAASTLSGGNQQKVAIAKSVALEPKVLVLNEPTRGVDVGARTEIYREIQALARQGLVVLFFSTDLEEIRELSQRVITVFRGEIVNDLPVEETTMDSILGDVVRGPVMGRAA
ncbi:ATP-binding cassette domain-containing protein [Rhizobium lusitanum]|uniref:Autoinducer 2 import ATP-binding protein LsrA n=1 Tax=Rhizobium lusitanum TaxID=293958 RepID=A0A6L9UCT3_9HYPH|nr:sugar ABC transporter ATP-binding protein [Rhizobium lusitanum]NEI72017.1 ATP-binding cassette domain-containing protein [Rhizobium lusitanum]